VRDGPALTSTAERPLRVLLVEDEPDDASMTLAGLHELERRPVVETASTLSGALDLLRAHAFDAALVDPDLPDSRGLDTVRRILEVAPDVPLVVVCATTSDALRRQVLELGAVDFMAKDESRPRLFARSLLYAIARHRATVERQLSNGLVSASPDAIVVSGADGTIRFVNAAAVALFGHPESTLVGAPLSFAAEPGETTEIQIPRRGAMRTAEMHVARFEWQGEDASLAVIRDVTERHALARQLRQAQKMEAVGTLAGGVAHDFNNLLFGILAFAGMLHDDLDPEDPRREDVSEIMRAAKSGAALTRELLAFSRQDTIAPTVVDLNALVRDTDRLLRRTIGEHVEVVTQLGARLWPVYVDPARFQQVLLNLAVNARDAMPDGGRLEIETANLPDGLESGPCAALRVTDTGTGIPEAIRATIFEPFFTTKDVGKGTGLGLAMVYGVVTQAGGTITVQSEVGRGTTFEIRLPRAEEAHASRRADRDGAVASGSETLLLVEDHALVRRGTVRILKSAGYSVLEASHGGEGIAVLEERGEEVSLVITDVVMPQMNGIETARRMRALRPELGFLFITGYAEEAVEAEGGFGDGAQVLHKPFTSRELLDCVRHLLDARRADRRSSAAPA